jgi:hypothetical protein
VDADQIRSQMELINAQIRIREVSFGVALLIALVVGLD